MGLAMQEFNKTYIYKPVWPLSDKFAETFVEDISFYESRIPLGDSSSLVDPIASVVLIDSTHDGSFINRLYDATPDHFERLIEDLNDETSKVIGALKNKVATPISSWAKSYERPRSEDVLHHTITILNDLQKPGGWQKLAIYPLDHDKNIGRDHMITSGLWVNRETCQTMRVQIFPKFTLDFLRPKEYDAKKEYFGNTSGNNAPQPMGIEFLKFSKEGFENKINELVNNKIPRQYIEQNFKHLIREELQNHNDHN